MQRNKLLYATLIIWMIAAAGCDKYLDVKPADKFLDDQVYNSKSSIQNALNGVYLNMAKADLYGENLSNTVVDVMAQYYNISNTSHRLSAVSTYAYDRIEAQTPFAAVWQNAYEAVLNLNLFIQKVSVVNESIVPAAERDWMLGEAHGLRAYLLFDMLRLFGPVYSANASALSIPYPEETGSATSVLLPAKDVIGKILADIQKAATLLENDPVRKEGVVPVGTDLNSFYKLRNRRMNYFAVKALEARAQLYAGNKPAALDAATKVIEQAGNWFPWTDPTTYGSLPDRIFSSEVLFGLETINLYNSYTTWFAASNSLSSSLLIPLYDKGNNVDRLLDVYERQENDIRYVHNWAIDRTSTLGVRTFYKYAAPGNGAGFRYLLPMMRISELYLIAAECETDPVKSSGYMNTLQFHRGLHELPPGYNLSAELKKAYQKEFWGEGQLFYYYKRTNTPSVANGSRANSTVTMGTKKYTVPLPLSETQFR
ncbi:RagB/SusD family nutrient uptake outer membrane protein [Pseudoflavitalea rhizosphaerae]|uniref:RagB/SusD family nutrient uptake outer membrane protein n=1 Tax=Pseudoflavitalea rhizosphaerae TaxID=1884793 RepID=UPI0013DF33D1|nr:RagB/SusD family nutrient uptake outer membrane protein [Pseudoflavitalea rhizosphaerae]